MFEDGRTSSLAAFCPQACSLANINARQSNAEGNWPQKDTKFTKSLLCLLRLFVLFPFPVSSYLLAPFEQRHQRIDERFADLQKQTVHSERIKQIVQFRRAFLHQSVKSVSLRGRKAD